MEKPNCTEMKVFKTEEHKLEFENVSVEQLQ